MPKQLLVKNFVKSLLLVFVLSFPITEVSAQVQQYEKADFMFSNADLKSVLMTLADQMKVNLLFDSSVKTAPIKFEHKNMMMREAFDKLLEQAELASIPFDRSIIVVFQNTPEIAQRIQEASIWTISDLKQGRGKHELNQNDDWLKMLKESGRSESLMRYSLKNVSLKAAVATLARQLDFVVMFDESVKNEKFDLVFSSATPIKVVESVFSSQKLRARILDERTIIVFADSADKYEKLLPWTANLSLKN